jgi:hypothetical protein
VGHLICALVKFGISEATAFIAYSYTRGRELGLLLKERMYTDTRCNGLAAAFDAIVE